MTRVEALLILIRKIVMNFKLLLSLFALLLPISVQAENPQDFTVHAPGTKEKFSLAEHKGKVVALHFLLKTECPYCLKHTHDYAKLAATTPDVVHVFLKPDTEAEITSWGSKLSRDGLKKLPLIYRDESAKLAAAYGIPDGYKFHGQTVRFPALVVLDGNGRELFRHVGKNNSDRLPAKEFTTKLAEAQSKKSK